MVQAEGVAVMAAVVEPEAQGVWEADSAAWEVPGGWPAKEDLAVELAGARGAEPEGASSVSRMK